MVSIYKVDRTIERINDSVVDQTPYRPIGRWDDVVICLLDRISHQTELSPPYNRNKIK